MNRSPSPDLTAKRAERQFERILSQRAAVAQVATTSVKAAALSAVEAVVAPGGSLDTRLGGIESRLDALEP
ncbi:hypothetical protein [uncultured Sphingorhabdus sp.]|uniref:hypothetical protein n=1 Tax=uncultured Sphingorhabdus sp. TaxID=1686106 RepID=UPI002603CC83|nr:hypothetical protein [uncultured Sphingorhabdus sp.]HMS21514.1 hypothetical protein [Sphingorhabdus sp.]